MSAPPSDAERFVTTADIRVAVKGREVEILDALGIPWRDGRPHIHCPNPDHLDKNPSWRFDERTGRAICSCGSHSIFDVLMQVEGITFDFAKIRAAEILGRQDLIGVCTGSKRYQRHDPTAYSTRRTTIGTTSCRSSTLGRASG